MRILYLTGHHPPDLTSGATLQVQRLAHAACAAGHEVRVVAGAYRSGLADGEVRDSIDVLDGGRTEVPVRWIGTGGWTDQDVDANWWNPAADRVVAELIEGWRPDVVHAHALQTLGGGVLQVACDQGVRTVVTMHDMWWWCARLFLVDRDMRPCSLVTCLGQCPCAKTAAWRDERARRLSAVLARVDLVLAPSAALRDVIVANGLAPERVRVDPNDVAIGARRTEVDEQALMTAPDVRFLYLGGPNPLKGADTICAAARHLAGTNGWRLVAHGLDAPASPGRSADVLPERVTVKPPFDPPDRDSVLAGADVLVLPSVARESFSLAAREALAAGLAVVTTDCLGPEEVVEHEVNGLVVPTGDPAGLAAAMRRLVDDRTLLLRLRRGAMATRLPSLDAAAHVQALLPLYSGSAAPAPRPVPSTLVVVGVDGDRARWRGHQAVEALRLLGAEATVAAAGDPSVIRLAAAHEVTILVDVPLEVAAPIIDGAHAAGRVVVFDADDLGVADAGALRHCDGALAATDAVARVLADSVGIPTAVVPPSVGVVDGLVADRLRSRPRTEGPLRVGVLADGPAGDAAWQTIEATVVATLASRSDVELRLLGSLSPGPITAVLGERIASAPAPAWSERGAALADLDVLLAPGAPPHAERRDVHAARQWVAAASVGTPVVASDIPALRAMGRPGRDLLVASGPDDWRRALESLLDDDVLRPRIGAAARRQVQLHHGPFAHARRLADALAGLQVSARDHAPLPLDPGLQALPGITSLVDYAAPPAARAPTGRLARLLRRAR